MKTPESIFKEELDIELLDELESALRLDYDLIDFECVLLGHEFLIGQLNPRATK